MNNSEYPAFPARHTELIDEGHGLTKREYFAAQILSGLVSDAKNFVGMAQAGRDAGVEEAKWMAQNAIDLADALLAEIEKSTIGEDK